MDSSKSKMVNITKGKGHNLLHRIEILKDSLVNSWTELVRSITFSQVQKKIQIGRPELVVARI